MFKYIFGINVEVYTVWGLGLVAQILFGSGPGSSLVQMTVIKRYIEY
jgi:hypothetical protein